MKQAAGKQIFLGQAEMDTQVAAERSHKRPMFLFASRFVGSLAEVIEQYSAGGDLAEALLSEKCSGVVERCAAHAQAVTS